MSLYSATILADSPQAYYRLNESSGTVATDSSGHGYNGTLSGINAYSQAGAIVGDSDTAITFAAAGGLTFPYNLNITTQTAATFECWVNLSGYGSGYYGQGPYGQGDMSPDSGWHHVAIATDATSTIYYLDGIGSLLLLVAMC